MNNRYASAIEMVKPEDDTTVETKKSIWKQWSHNDFHDSSLAHNHISFYVLWEYTILRKAVLNWNILQSRSCPEKTKTVPCHLGT